MIEEAAGTKMYDAKRLTAMNTIEKKQLKVDEIEKVKFYILKKTLFSWLAIFNSS